MGTSLFQRRIRLATATFPLAICACAACTLHRTPQASSDLDAAFAIIALGIMALSISFLVWHPDDFAPRACGRCRRFVRVLEVPFAKTEGLERLKQAVEAAEIDGIASLAATPVPTGGRDHWVCLRLEACPACADRARVTLVELPRERVLAGPRATPRSPSDLIAAGARRRERAQPYVGVRLLS